MIPQVVFVRISRLRIEITYSHESQPDTLVPIVDECRRDNFCNGQSLDMAISMKLDDVVRSIGLSVEQSRSKLPIALICGSDVLPAEQTALLQGLSEHGFINVGLFDLGQTIATGSLNHEYTLVLSSDGEQVYCSLYKSPLGKQVARRSIVASDPRIGILSEYIWRQISSKAGYLVREKAMPAITAVANDFLQSGRNEIPAKDARVVIDGRDYTFFVRRRNAEVTNSVDVGSNDLLNQVNEFILSQGIEKHQCALVLSEGMSDNSYFSDIFNGSFSEMTIIGREQLASMLKAIAENIRLRDYELSQLMDGGNVPKIALSGVVDEIPYDNIKARIGEDYIAFNITFPPKALELEVYRDDMLVGNLTTSQFTDYGLIPEHEYHYRFISVFRDEQGATLKSRGRERKFTTISVDLPRPVDLKLTENERQATIRWVLPARGTVKFYRSQQPFGFHYNERIDMAHFESPCIETLEQVYTLEKNFCGELFFLPITVVGQTGIVGNEISVLSMIPPRGARLDTSNPARISVHWLWDGSADARQGVRVRWWSDGGNEQYADVVNDGRNAPEYYPELPNNVQSIEVAISCIYRRHDGSLVESACEKRRQTLKQVKVDFRSFKDESTWFRKNRYSITLRANAPLPSSLDLVITENHPLYDVNNYSALLTIDSSQVKPGTEKKVDFGYTPLQRKAKIYARLIVADSEMSERIIITPIQLFVNS